MFYFKSFAGNVNPNVNIVTLLPLSMDGANSVKSIYIMDTNKAWIGEYMNAESQKGGTPLYTVKDLLK